MKAFPFKIFDILISEKEAQTKENRISNQEK